MEQVEQNEPRRLEELKDGSEIRLGVLLCFVLFVH